MIHDKKVLGVIGGMGPMATVDLFKKIVENTKADSDAEHIHILIDNNISVPDRTKSILSGSDAPLEYLTESARRLSDAGADVIIIPCNTSHFFLDRLKADTGLCFVSMTEATAAAAAKTGIHCAGLLATNGTIAAGVYEKAFDKFGIELVKPSEEGQRQVMSLIYDEVKAGRPTHPEALEPELKSMESRGAELFILGCTELPMAFEKTENHKFLDPTMILARAAIQAVGYEVKTEA